MTRTCKFCGCTERRACLLVAVETVPGRPHIYPLGAIVVVPANAESRLVPCEWFLADVCSNPDCIEKAYLEARPLAEAIDAELQLQFEEAA